MAFYIRNNSRAIGDPDPHFSPVPGYRGPIPFGNSIINAPLDDKGRDTYLGKQCGSVCVFDYGADNRASGYKFYLESYIPEICCAACTSTTNYNSQHLDGESLECVGRPDTPAALRS